MQGKYSGACGSADSYAMVRRFLSREYQVVTKRILYNFADFKSALLSLLYKEKKYLHENQ